MTEHLEYEEIERYVDGSATAVERELVEGHAELCDLCRMELRDLEAVRDSMKVRPMRRANPWRWVAAATVIVALAAMWFVFRARPRPGVVVPQVATAAPAPAPQVEPVVLEKPAILNELVRGEGVLRGGEARAFALEEPVGTVVLEERPRFRWSAVDGASGYEVAVVDAARGEVVASGSSETTRWQPNVALPRGRTYTWQVTARVGDSSLVAPGPSGAEALFHIAAQDGPLPEKAFERGVALARMGVLDDAERELDRAAREGEPRAAALLAQVKSWR